MMDLTEVRIKAGSAKFKNLSEMRGFLFNWLAYDVEYILTKIATNTNFLAQAKTNTSFES